MQQVMSRFTVMEEFAAFLESFFGSKWMIEKGPEATMELISVPSNPELSSLFVWSGDSLSSEVLKQVSAVHLAIETLSERELYPTLHKGLVHHDFRLARTTFMYSDLVPVVVHAMHRDAHVSKIMAKYIRMIMRFHNDELYSTGRYRSISFDSTGKPSTIRDEQKGIELVDVPTLFRVETSEYYVYNRDAETVEAVQITGP